MAAGNNLANLATPITALQSAIAGGSLAYAAQVDAMQTFTSYVEVLGGVGFQNGWVNFGAGPNTAAYLKDALGFVHLRGAIKSGTINTTAFTLPAGYRPSNTVAFATTSNNLFGSVTVDASGNVNPNVGSNIFIYLDAVCFLATQ